METKKALISFTAISLFIWTIASTIYYFKVEPPPTSLTPKTLKAINKAFERLNRADDCHKVLKIVKKHSTHWDIYVADYLDNPVLFPGLKIEDATTKKVVFYPNHMEGDKIRGHFHLELALIKYKNMPTLVKKVPMFIHQYKDEQYRCSINLLKLEPAIIEEN